MASNQWCIAHLAFCNSVSLSIRVHIIISIRINRYAWIQVDASLGLICCCCCFCFFFSFFLEVCHCFWCNLLICYFDSCRTSQISSITYVKSLNNTETNKQSIYIYGIIRSCRCRWHWLAWQDTTPTETTTGGRRDICGPPAEHPQLWAAHSEVSAVPSHLHSPTQGRLLASSVAHKQGLVT